MNELVKVDPSELDNAIKQSGLQIIEGEEIKGSYLPFLNQLADIQSQSVKINFENPTRLDEEIAGTLRKATVKVRTGASNVKDDRNRTNLLKQKLEVASFKLIEASCKLTEDVFLNVEKAREIAEKKRIQELQESRTNELSPFMGLEFTFISSGLGSMDEATYQNYLSSVKLGYEAKIKAEQEAETERLRLIEVDKEIARLKEIEDERIRKENELLKQQTIEAEKKFEAERIKQAQILAKQKAEADEKARIESEKQAAILAKERAEAKTKQDAIEKQAKIEREIAESERNALAAKIAAKESEERILKAEAEKKEADRIAAEKAAAKAPDKEKLTKMVESITIAIPELSDATSVAVANVINAKFEAFKIWANSQIQSI
ncbi:MAG TPA: hypothetical protein VIK55_06470 [Paludibacter sp.]